MDTIMERDNASSIIVETGIEADTAPSINEQAGLRSAVWGR